MLMMFMYTLFDGVLLQLCLLYRQKIVLKLFGKIRTSISIYYIVIILVLQYVPVCQHTVLYCNCINTLSFNLIYQKLFQKYIK